jgi:hypothetical protein
MLQPGIPWRPLAALSAAVVLAHLALLQAAPRVLDAPEPLMKRVWSMRTVVLKPVAASPATDPAPKASSAPDPTPAPRPIRPRVTRYAAPTESSATPPAAQAATVEIASAPAEPPAVAQPPAPVAQSPVSAPTTPAATAEPSQPPRDSAAGTSVAFTVPGSSRLKFNVTALHRKMSYDVNGELLWLHDGTNYEARMEVGGSIMGSRVQTSSGRIGAQGLAPTRFGDKSRSHRAAHFDRDAGRVIFSANTPDAALLAGAQDRLSVLMQLASMLAGDPARYPPGTTIPVQTVGPRDADTWLFTVEGEESLNVANADYATLRLIRNPRREFDTRVEAWFAPKLGYLPVRIRLTESNGDWVDQRLRSLEKP